MSKSGIISLFYGELSNESLLKDYHLTTASPVCEDIQLLTQRGVHPKKIITAGKNNVEIKKALSFRVNVFGKNVKSPFFKNNSSDIISTINNMTGQFQYKNKTSEEEFDLESSNFKGKLATASIDLCGNLHSGLPILNHAIVSLPETTQILYTFSCARDEMRSREERSVFLREHLEGDRNIKFEYFYQSRTKTSNGYPMCAVFL